ncbi:MULTISPECIES: RNA methyltransferase [Candidatus Ichthyocystis]|uniref:RNA methyltransferase n=1 Tax=Candidatus Ichthyocystis TaxID=2929841 RepID=UPI000A90BD2C|nr:MULTISPECIES: RNA methyltransferase [Ichthyocystis]
MLDLVGVVLCGTSNPGNIGASARAMKNMGLRRLCLVGSQLSKEDSVELARSSHACDVLEQALSFGSLSDAVAQSSCVLGLTSRLRKRNSVVSLSLPDAIGMVLPLIRQGKYVSFVFGSEKTGLTNEQLMSCSRAVYILASDEYPSLNLAAAVQVVCYELRRQLLLGNDKTDATEQRCCPATAQEFFHLMDHLNRVLEKIRFCNRLSASTMSKFRRIYSKANLEKEEVALLRGLLSQVEYCLSESE